MASPFGSSLSRILASNLLVSQNAENEEAELASAKSIQAVSVEITAMGTDIQACFTRRLRPVTC
ncbi:hypothetical protein [Microcoleus sp. MON1_C5]|uniref:hypothetical protein n=1 Tax=Microcoleus sp. MON1_C5 TaxID=2818828 RepID=UPI002FD319B9